MATANIGTIRGERGLRRRTQAEANRSPDSGARPLAIRAAGSESAVGMGPFLLRCCAILAALFLAVPASAHPVPFSYLDLEVHDSAVDGRIRAHLVDLAPVLGLSDPQALLDPAVRNAHRAEIERYLASHIAFENGGFARARWGEMAVVDADEAIEVTFSIPGPPEGALALDTNLFPADPNHQTFVNVYEGDALRQQFILSAATDPVTYYRGTTAGALAVMSTFIPSGVHHIMIGPDHILFLIGLLLLGGSLRKLVTIVTMFTVGHSITLTLAALDIVTPPAWLIEPAIALSIVVVGADNLLQRKEQGRDLRVWVAGAFGLIHGFGFANVLREFGLPQEALGWSLFSFNVGVELGQLVIVLVVGLALALLRKRLPTVAEKWVVPGGSVVVIAAGAYWFVERVFFGG
jgi:hydrogenase/urease accessory protein HupE